MVVNGGIRIRSGSSLDDVLAFNLEKDVIGGERTQGFHRRWIGEVGGGFCGDGLLGFTTCLVSYAGSIVVGEVVLGHVLVSVDA